MFENTLIQVYEPSLGKTIQLGKLVHLTKGAAYVNNISAHLRTREAFGIAPCVLALMIQLGVKQILYIDQPIEATFFTDVATALQAPLFAASAKRRPYYHLPIAQWKRLNGAISTPWVSHSNTRTLAWIDQAPGASPPAATIQERANLATTYTQGSLL